MREVGLVGFGSMGRMLAEGLLAASAVPPAGLAVAARRAAALDALAGRWPGVLATTDARAVAGAVRVLVLCVPPPAVRPLLAELAPALSPDAHVVSIAAGVSLETLARAWPGRLTRVMPSLASETGAGVSLVCHGPSVDADAAARVERLLAPFGAVVPVAEADIPVAMQLTSCGPALLASMVEHLVQGALRRGSLPEATARRLAATTLLGTARLVAERGLTLPELIARVTTPGGVTEAGGAVLARRLPEVVDELFEEALARYRALEAATADGD